MVNKKLGEYIEVAIHKGLSISQAKEKLLKAGHKKADVEEAASRVLRIKHEKVGAVILGVIIIAALVGLVADNFFKQEVPVEIVYESPTGAFGSLQDAIAAGDVTACEQFNEIKKRLCILSIEGEIGEDNSQFIPETESTVLEAAEKKDPTLCEGLSGVEKDRCLALSGGFEPETPELYYFDSETNETVPTEYQLTKDIIAEAVATGDESLCDQISSASQRRKCKVKVS